MFVTLFCLFAFLFFIGASAKKFRDYAKLPMHGRQDLYPIPGEEPARAEHGGSYYEEQKWYEKPRRKNHIGEIIDMVEEMLFIKKLFKKQPKLWWVSYALHLGIYCVIATIVIAAAAVLLPFSGILAGLLSFAITVAGISGGILVCIGAIGLLVKRIVDHEFRNYTTPQEYFNLVFLFAGAFSGLCAWYKNGRSLSFVKDVVNNILHLKPTKGLNKTTILHLILFSGLMIYIPLTKMSHYVGKYFAFHKVLWDNAPNLPGSKVDETFAEQSSIKPAPE
ncbi:MAG: respiratory nitrate reductase subunit gamma, partial [Vagococcus sp.]|nr:respiratory nitrate reductase subunit gamma [Vagococcus sp.]